MHCSLMLLLQTQFRGLVQVNFGLPTKYVPLIPSSIYFKLVVENCVEKKCWRHEDLIQKEPLFGEALSG